MNYIENHVFDEIQVGDSATLTRILSKEDIELFAQMAGDVNPAHVDEDYAKGEIFHISEKKDIVQNAIDVFRALGLGTPKVAILSAIETVNEKIPSTLDATTLCKMAERGQITGGILDGPLAFDNAVSIESARIKNIYSQVAGDADILVVPDIESGNMIYKQMTYLAGLEAAGMVVGAKVPIILVSRGSDVLSRKASSVMALLYVRKSQGGA